MKASFLIFLAISAVSATTTSDGQQSAYTGGDGQSSQGENEATGEVNRPISTSGDADAHTLSFEDEYADDKLISEILSQVSHDDGLPTDLMSSLVSNDGHSQDDNSLMAQINRIIQLGAEEDDDDREYGQISGDGKSTGETSSGGNGPQTGAETGKSEDADDNASSNDITAFVLKQLDVAKQIFENAKSQILEAEIAGKDETSIKSAVSTNTRLAASSVITSAKAKARTSILDARKDYLLAIDKAKRDITVMKIIEKRFRILAIGFAKARNFAGKAILTLKRLAPESDEDDDDRSFGYNNKSKRNFLSAVSSAKSNIAKLKAVEKAFLSITRALARGRALAYTNVRKVRKSGISLAQAMTMSEMAVKAAVDTAKSLISQAISTSRATAYAKIQVTSMLAQKAEIQAHLAVQLAANALSAAKDQGESSDDSDNSAELTDDYGINSSSQQKGAEVQSSVVAASDKGYY